MLTPQFQLPIHHELVIDLFAGGGGASTGIEEAIGRPVDIAVNHNVEAVAMHTANHPQTKHYVSDVFEVDPVAVCQGRPVGMLWASPDCKHFSKAKGGKPVSKKIRGLAWVVIKWAKLVRPRVIFLENVEEFQTWGPLDANNMPCKLRKGRTFQRWKKSLENLGYTVNYQEYRACDLGTPTIRKRLFLVARCDGLPIVVPEQTHAPADSLPVRQRKAKPYRTAAECIQWDQPAPSIFERPRELADATKRRIAKGIMRYVVNAAEPFIVPLTHQGGDRTEAIGEPFKTITGANRGEKALIVPTLVQTGYGERDGQAPRALDIQKPLGTVVGGSKHALVTAFLTEHANASTQRVMPADEPMRTQMGEVKGGHFSVVSASLVKNYTGVVGSDMQDPMGTVTSVDHHSLLTASMVKLKKGAAGQAADEPVGTLTTSGDTALSTAHLVHLGHGEGKDGTKRFSHGIRDVQDPLNTITASGATAGLITSNLIKLRGTSKEGQPVTDPLHTISAGGTHHAEVRAFLIKYYGTDQDPRLDEPMHTIPTKDRFGLVMVKGQPYAIVDIGLRMLKPRELYRAQGFKDSYIIDWGIHPHTGEKIKLTATASIRMCGNSVCPPMARAYVAANYTERQALREAA
ncbi:MAG: DNA cytosine methyltransferase [Ramlibacter sp.]|nr:DNA cytosine methyltransferase [Ramlibacter sp.]